MSSGEVFQSHLEELCEELQPLLEGEIDAGNEVVETWKGDWPIENCIYVLFAKPLQTVPEDLPEGLRLSHMGEIYYWGDEIVCDRVNHVLAGGRT